ncbi:MAG: alpha/beta hydrolase [Bacteroidales bacterium]
MGTATAAWLAALLSVPCLLAAQSYQQLVARFDYDTRAPLDVREVGVEGRGAAKIHDITYGSPRGGRVPAYLVVPDGQGPFAAVIWGHWYWSNSEFRNRREFLDEALVLARSGVVSLLFDGPVARPGFFDDETPLNEKQIDDRMQTILDVRRAADLLLARRDVDPKRLGYVGHSYNASTGGYLAGIDKRFKAFVLMAGSLSDKVDLESKEYRDYRQAVGPGKFDAFINKFAWLDPGLYLPHATPAAVLMQYATKEGFLTVERAKQYAQLVSVPKQFEVYDAPHALNAAARRDRAKFLRDNLRLRALDMPALDALPELVQPPPEPTIERKTAVAPDGVSLAYSAAGAGDTALVFIHGGFADRSFFTEQFHALSGRYRVVAIDLAGHGESGTNRTAWGIPQFGADVKAVVDAEKLRRVVLFGNSLGGPVAIEAALLLPGRVLGVVGIDTFQDLGHPETPEYAKAAAEAARQRLEAFRKDYAGSMKAMVAMLFHSDADPWLVAEAQRRMMRTTPEIGAAMLAGAASYDYSTSAHKLTVPVRAINGDLYPTDVLAARRVKADFDVVVMKHCGHYPMLERADEFNRHVVTVVQALERAK